MLPHRRLLWGVLGLLLGVKPIPRQTLQATRITPIGTTSNGKRLKTDATQPDIQRIDEAEFTKDELDHMKEKKKTARCSATTGAALCGPW